MGNNEVMLGQIKELVWQRLLRTKRMHGLLDSESCAYAYANASKERRIDLMKLIQNSDEKGLKLWIKDNSKGSLEHWSYRELRDKGKELNIPKWSRLDRDELISKIKEQQDEGRVSGD